MNVAHASFGPASLQMFEEISHAGNYQTERSDYTCDSGGVFSVVKVVELTQERRDGWSSVRKPSPLGGIHQSSTVVGISSGPSCDIAIQAGMRGVFRR
jgi:hypothetical protein